MRVESVKMNILYQTKFMVPDKKTTSKSRTYHSRKTLHIASEKLRSMKLMDRNLSKIKTEIFDKCPLEISNFKVEPESREYGACRFDIGERKIISRNSKITPKKVGQFVTFWKRNENGPIEPFHQNDQLDFYVVNVRTESKLGQFVFPRSVLINKGIISTDTKEGKRAFRVYPGWDTPNNKQAQRNQKWQLNYFYEIGDATDLKKVSHLYSENSK